SAQGLGRGLGDERLSAALRAMHDRPGHPWTVVDLAKEAALSRSAFFARFNRIVGVAPMEYLLTWRMALARQFLPMIALSSSASAPRGVVHFMG
ncbi:AraC family transcriptional regulator, partial [Mesorhizobium sp. M8A.F.Ca.ET.161.01.1.1]|uniref:AraC family transcriptional regulator n=1 Tax=Mesorhizobium sp. M8A.F.Ca.ET.161.01.1.1 TaxID=2563959 RepID=UPI0010933910